MVTERRHLAINEAIDNLQIQLKNKTSYASVSSANWENIGEGYALVKDIQIPQGAVVTGAVVYGSSASPDWLLRRIDSSGTKTTLATASVNTEDTSISNATIDNDNYGYFFLMETPSGETVNFARVSYTTDYI